MLVIEIICPRCGEKRKIQKKSKDIYKYRKNTVYCSKCASYFSRRTDKEHLESGVIIDWTNTIEGNTEFQRKESVRQVSIQCIDCKGWRYALTARLTKIRKGQQRRCWNCHKDNLLKTKSKTGIKGKYLSSSGYYLCSEEYFDSNELSILNPMFYSKGIKNKAISANKFEIWQCV